jgi:hypothetical protein
VERKLITCPESAHLEEIEMERTPDGIVIISCSRFSPACAVECAVECAVRMNRRDRLRAANPPDEAPRTCESRPQAQKHP